jgi:hypothetical protein
MAKMRNSRLADDIRASLREARDLASGKTTKAVVHRVRPRETEAREAGLMPVKLPAKRARRPKLNKR